MGKIIRLTESDLHRIVRNTLNEISGSTLDNALSQNPNLGDLDDSGEKFGTSQWENTIGYAIRTIKEGLQFYMAKMSEEGISNNKQLNDALNGVEAVERFFVRKRKQWDNFNDRLSDITREGEY